MKIAAEHLHISFFVLPRAHRAASTVKRGAMPTRLNEITPGYFCRGAWNTVDYLALIVDRERFTTIDCAKSKPGGSVHRIRVEGNRSISSNHIYATGVETSGC